jgi:hypothetical protein
MITDEDRRAAERFISPSDGDFNELSGLFATHREAAFKAGQEAERASVVKWLRDISRDAPACAIRYACADAIERHAHTDQAMAPGASVPPPLHHG